MLRHGSSRLALLQEKGRCLLAPEGPVGRVAAHVLHAVSPAICFSDCLWGGVRQRPTADNGQRRLPTSILALDVNASAILRLGLPSTTSRTPPPGAGHVRSPCTTSTTSWRSVAGEYRKSASIPSRGEGSPIPWPGELGRGVWVPRVSGEKGSSGAGASELTIL